MNDSPSTPPAPDGAQLSDLLQNVEWLRRLARRLASSDAEAEDIAQRTWLAALRNRPEARGATIRPWLTQVLRNEARMERRSRRRRLEREALVAAEANEQGRPPADELASELEERFRLQQRLMAAVAGLDQPYRSSVIAAYFEGLSAADLAARDDVSIRTVESRLRRGREALRQKLDAHFGAREAWAALALPLLPLGGPIAPPRAADPSTSVSPSLVSKTLKTGATAVTIKSAWIGAAALVALVLAWQLSLDVEPLAAQGSEVAILDAEVATALETPLPAAEPSVDRVTAQRDAVEPMTVDANDSGSMPVNSIGIGAPPPTPSARPGSCATLVADSSPQI